MTTTGDPNQVVPLIRERQVLDPVASGQSNKVIARELDISHNTVKLHVRHIMDKLHLRSLMQVRQVVCHTPAVLAGLALLESGGDFADAVIAFEGELLGGTEFVSFDQQAIKLLKAQKRKVRLLGP
ncbi:MAG: LuxR C-terminal-related transcriptional regulator [Rhodoferax sp.]|nr:LuxR C-terminal-related transcriptional regulator [Rhodoferax sp.]